MSRETKRRGLKVIDGQQIKLRHRRSFARWRALSLSLVYVVFAVHIIHWKLAGKTLAPLELNEVMYALEYGVITAGFLFMCLLVLGTLIFGRFFCSWACHIMVLQDLCAFLLRKLGVARKPIRSRLLLLIPPLAACYMFVWPQLVRVWHCHSFPEFHFRTDAEGWASFATTNFWRNLPSAPIIILTFLVCGFGMVYLLGSRTFCTYICPYGAIFGLADRFAPGRIRVNDRCRQCGTCTAACTSGVRVHEEVARHGTIVNPACLKDLDCISVCPASALSYGFGRPSLLKSRVSGGRLGRQPFDFALGEEALMLVVFAIVFISFRGLYSRIPFLLSLALGVVMAYLAVISVRLARQSNLKLAGVPLREAGRVTALGRAWAVCVALLVLFIGHCAFVRYHEYVGLKSAMAMNQSPAGPERNQLAAAAARHLRIADHWGLMHNERVERSLFDASVQLGRFAEADVVAARLLEQIPDDAAFQVSLAQLLAVRGQTDQAERAFRELLARLEHIGTGVNNIRAQAHRALGAIRLGKCDYAGVVVELTALLRLDPNCAEAHAELGSALAELNRVEEAIEHLRRATQLDPKSGLTHYNLGTLLASQGRFDQAITQYRSALAAGYEDADLHNNLGFALLQSSQPNSARDHFERALQLDPGHAGVRFNLENTLVVRGATAQVDQLPRPDAPVVPGN